MKKCISILTICLMLSLCVTVNSVSSITIETTSTGNTLYVGGSGPGNYTKIQDAIDNASDNDTVFVYSGVYYENIHINRINIRGLSLIGENREKTIIDGGNSKAGSIISIYSVDNVTISNFQIRNNISSEDLMPSGISIDNSDNNVILGNIIKANCIRCIECHGSKNNNISQNIIEPNHFYLFGYLKQIGISLVESDNNTVFKNRILSHHIGVSTHTSDNNTVFKNEICDNLVGVEIYRGSGNEIICNNFIRNRLNAHFEYENHLMNKWDNNYWNRPRVLPKIIIGVYLYFPNGAGKIKIDFDWHPALKPYDI